MSDYEPLLPGIGFGGYRSFASWQQFEFPTKVTVLAGINNSGKSNVLRFLQSFLAPMTTSGPSAHQQPPGRIELGDLDRPRGFDRAEPLCVGIPVQVGSRGPAQDPASSGGAVAQDLAGYQEGAMSILANDEGVYWSTYALTDGRFAPWAANVKKAMEAWPNWSVQHYDNALRGVLGGGTVDPQDVMVRVLSSIGRFDNLPRVTTISSARRVEATDDLETDWLSGRGIIRALGAIQNPPHNEWDESRPRWAAINRFVKTVLGDEDASLNVPHDFSTIQVDTPQRVLPLASLGSGVEQVVVLAAAATVTSNHLVCLEEPETNLHPILQKKLVRYLTDETDNQYVIATHSAHLLDDARATAYHIRLTTEGSDVRLARRPHELVDICHDLGYRPSDLLQANCVIWVEGPSDRTYLRRWIELADSSLAEGIDYTIMFYGGKLLSHLTASDEALEQFISLRALNRSSAVVIDSDKTDSRKHINATKKRIKDEFEAAHPAPGFAWVTKCYTVENYVPPELLKDAVESVHPSVSYTAVGQWANPLASAKGDLKYDKVGIADKVAPSLLSHHLDVYDLRKQILALCAFIKSANGQSIAPEHP